MSISGLWADFFTASTLSGTSVDPCYPSFTERDPRVGDMDILKSKPGRSWRAFLKEYAIIVVGVLTALAAEQAVSKLHERTLAAEARRAIRGELALDLAYLRTREETNACIERRLGEIQAILDSAHPDGGFRRPTWVGRPQAWTMETLRWDAAAQSGQASMIPADELGRYTRMYTQLRGVTDEMDIEQADWAKLRVLANLHRLPAQALYDLNLILNDARYRNWRIHLSTRQQVAESRKVELTEIPTNRFRASLSVCVPMTASHEEGLRLSQFPLGEL